MSPNVRFPIKSFSGIAILLVIMILAGCVAPVELTSTHGERTVLIDGKSEDWGPSLTPLTSPDISIGFHHDETSLSLCLITEDHFLQSQILTGGFTVWFDVSAGTARSLGIRFPLDQGQFPMRILEQESLENILPSVVARLLELEIVGKEENETQRFSLIQAPGIAAKIGASGHTLIYELRVPLGKTDGPFRLQPAGQQISVGLEAAKFETGDRVQAPSTRTSLGGRRSRRSAPPTNIGGGEQPEHLDTWIKLNLAGAQP